jgi:hypothetical protein
MKVITWKDYCRLFNCFPVLHKWQKGRDGLAYRPEYIENETIVLSVHPKPEQLIFDLSKKSYVS